MQQIKSKCAEWSNDRALVRAACIVLAVALALLVGLCISSHIRSNIQKEYSALVYTAQEETCRHLEEMQQLFNRIDDPTVDVRYKLIPELKAQYTAAAALNAVLAQRDGRALMSEELTTDFAAAFEEYANSYRAGTATGLARADMSACMEQVAQILEQRYPAPEDPNAGVVIIDAASGKTAT